MKSFNGKFRDELLACEAFNMLAEAKVLIEQWRRHYNTVRPHSLLGWATGLRHSGSSCRRCQHFRPRQIRRDQLRRLASR